MLGQITDNPDPFAARGWADGYSSQLQLQWNFFDGGAAKSRARQREIDIALSEERFSQLRNQIRFEVEQAFYDLQANFENIGVANLGVEPQKRYGWHGSGFRRVWGLKPMSLTRKPL